MSKSLSRQDRALFSKRPIMAPMSKGVGKPLRPIVSKAKKVKTGTVTTKQHRFESFTQRIAKLRIEPIRREKQARALVNLEGEACHFKTSLEEWKDLNLTEDFVTFARKVEPLCQTLPQLLHHQDQIMSHLVAAIDMENPLSLEPLLNLMVHFGHDLGSRFEVFFERAVRTLSRLAAKHADVRVIEWSFTSLAWIFKYLSRLLVLDLRPVYTLMAPLLGRERQKSFVTRFAAEALSYLIRKASTMYKKTSNPLKLIVGHILTDLIRTEEGQTAQYLEGLTELFNDTMQGVQKGLHSGAPHVVRTMVDQIFSLGEQGSRPILIRLLELMLVKLREDVDAFGFHPIFVVVMDATVPNQLERSFESVRLAASMVSIVVDSNLISEASDWDILAERVDDLLDRVEARNPAEQAETSWKVLNILVSILVHAPRNLLPSSLETTLDRITSKSWSAFFLEFCIVVCESGCSAFRSPNLISRIQRFVESEWPTAEPQLCMILPRLSSLIGHTFRIPLDWQKSMLDRLRSLCTAYKNGDTPHLEYDVILCNFYLDILRHGLADDSVREQSIAVVREIVTHALQRQTACLTDTVSRLALGKWLLFLTCTDPTMSQMLSQICHMSQAAATLPAYLEAVCNVLRDPSIELHSTTNVDMLVDELIENLAAPVHELRLMSLEALQAIYLASKQETPNAIEVALGIEGVPFTLDNARAAALGLRRIAASFEASASDLRLQRALPAYCFGLHHVKLSSVWDEAATALEAMSNIKQVDDMIMERVTSWIRLETDRAQDEQNQTQEGTVDDETNKYANYNAYATMQLSQTFKNEIRTAPRVAPNNREQALRILNKIPQLAEKRSRVVVPTLLAWAGNDELEDEYGEDEITNTLSVELRPLRNGEASTRWSRPDQKALLNVFAQFHNPAVLYRSSDVYDALLSLLCNGDAMIQKSALKAIFSWKSPALKPYHENLLNILDDARFRDELSVFLTTDDNTNTIQAEHRPTLMPVVLRLLYGRIVNRSDSKHGSKGQETKRKATLITLANFGQDELGDFVSIVLGPLCEVQLLHDGKIHESVMQKEVMQTRRQQGLLRLLKDMLEILPHLLTPQITKLSNAVLYCAIRASRENSPNGATKIVRQDSLICFGMLLGMDNSFDWSAYSEVILEELVMPRLHNLPIETAQGVSAILKLFSSISQSEGLTRLFLVSRTTLVERVADCLNVPSARDEVKVFILNDIFRNLITHASKSDDVAKSTLSEDDRIQTAFGAALTSFLLPRLAALLARMPARECLEATVATLISLGPFLDDTADSASLIQSAGILLRQPSRTISPRIKGDVLRLLERFVPLHNFSSDKENFHSFYLTLSSLFAYFKDAPNRQALVNVFGQLVRHEPPLVEIADICRSLNSFASVRLDEPDFDSRLRTFDIINNQRYESFTAQEWRPIIHNMLFFIRDNDELSIRTSAGFALRRFARVADNVADFEKMLFDDVVPALVRGSTDASELVRSEYISVFAEVVRGKWSQTADLKILLGPDEEASFFNNVLHIQQHRRLRALRRLATDASVISSANINRFCIPVVRTYLTDVDEGTQNLAAEAATALEALCQGLDWSSLRSLLQNLVSETSKLESKLQIRAIGAVVNALSRASEERLRSAQKSTTDGVHTMHDVPEPTSHLARTLPPAEKLATGLSKSVLAKLMDYIHYKDESTVDLRVVLAVIVVKIIMTLPAEDITIKLPAVIMDVCNILRSRAQEARDAARTTLAEIAALIGSGYFGFILKQLRTTLQRGYQIHVLSYTIHSVLYSVTAKFQSGDLDYCIPDLMAIIMDDIFGVAGQEKDAEEYISRMKEVKAKRLSYDSMKLLASITTLPHISSLLDPVKAQIEQPRPKMDKVDEILHTLREGLRGNSTVQDRQALTLCFEILQKAYQTGDGVQTHASASSSKMVSFGLSLLERIIKKHEHLKTVENMTGFMPFLSSSLAHGEEDVQIAAFRTLTTIMKVPIAELDEAASTYIRHVTRTVQASASTNTPLAQEALRLATSVLLERPNAAIKHTQFENQMSLLLKRIKPDLNEPSREAGRGQQLAAFKFLKAVLSRGVLLKEIYEIMDVVREVMLTSPENSVLEDARNVYSRFVLEYFPEGGKGFDKQLKFLVTNLQYPHERGRKAIMEVLFFLLRKTSDSTVQVIMEDIFLPLVIALATDDSKDCRASAKIVLQKMFERADKDQTRMIKTRLFTFLDAQSQAALKRIGLECWAIYFGQHLEASKDAATVYGLVSKLLNNEKDVKGREAGLRVAAALDLLTLFCDLFPAVPLNTSTAEDWSTFTEFLHSAHIDVQISCAGLVRAYLGHFIRQAAGANQPRALPLTGSEGMVFAVAEASHVAKASFIALQTATSEMLVDRLTENLAIIGRVAAGGESQQVLDRLLRQAAAVIRRDDTEQTLRSRLATLKFVARLCQDLSAEALQPSLHDILLPLLNLTDQSVSTAGVVNPENKGLHEELVRMAQELLDSFQTKLGTSRFIAGMQIVQREVKERREERRAKRRIEAVSAPEKAGRDKQKKNEIKKVKRREKNAQAAGHRRGW